MIKYENDSIEGDEMVDEKSLTISEILQKYSRSD